MPKSKAVIDLDQPVYGVAEVAAYCGILKNNVRKMLDRYGVKPYANLASTGPIWRRRDVVRMQEKRLANEVGRAADEKRRIAAREG